MKYCIVTGASSGFGYAVTKRLLSKGYMVLAIARKTEKLKKLKSQYEEHLFVESLDVTDRKKVLAVVPDYHKKTGRIDILFSNAGYIHFGAFEETSDDQMRREMEVNFFGAVNVIQAVLPFMREQRSGHILQTTSIGGLVSYPFSSGYHASKWALEGLLQTVQQEVREFGIQITLVEPGNFATNLVGAKQLSNSVIEDYSETYQNHIAYCNSSGKDAEDTEDAAEEIVRMMELKKPPFRVLLGTGLYDAMQTEYDNRLNEWKTNQWEERGTRR